MATKLRYAAILSLAFAALTATAAEKPVVKFVGSRSDGISYWVKYTINGMEYRSDMAGGRWRSAKAAGVKWAKPKKGAALPEVYDEASGKGLIVDTAGDKTNLSAMKLTYTPKKGTFKGTFKMYALAGAGKAAKLKKYTVKVSGVVVDGVGSGTATCRTPAVSWGVSVTGAR